MKSIVDENRRLHSLRIAGFGRCWKEGAPVKEQLNVSRGVLPKQGPTNVAFQAKIHSVCGRYRLSRRKQILAEHFDTDFDDLDWEPRYNIAPTQPVVVIRRRTGALARQVSMMRWGLIPSWANAPDIGARTMNARAETVATKPSFR